MNKISLCYDWDFVKGFEERFVRSTPEQAQKIDLPHSVKTLPFDGFSDEDCQGEFTYIKTFDYEGEDKKVYLRFDGAMLQFDLYLNETSLGHFVSGFLPVEVEITSILKKGKNRLVVALDSREDKNIPPFGGVVDYLCFGGLYREVYLLEYPQQNGIHHAYVKGNANGEIAIKANIDGKDSITVEIYDNELKIASFQGFSGTISSPHLYSPEDPHLYLARIKTSTDSLDLPFAFFDASFTKDGFFLNGKKRQLLGLNRHQIYPYIGMAASASLQREDARILKKMGLDLVRTSHYPQHDAFLDECARLGIFVLDEIPGWQYVGSTKTWREHCLDFTKRMILKDRTAPSLLAYGVRIDESRDDHELYSSLNKLSHELDPYRPTLGVRNFKESECLEDIYGYNDFSCSNLSHGVDPLASWSGAENKPKIISEHSGHMFPTKSYDPTERRIEHALRHAKVIEDFFAQEELCACIGWCAFDYATHKDFGSTDHICYHGVASSFRAFKPAGYLYASQGEDPLLYVASTIFGGDFNGALVPPTPVFSNADYLELFREGKFVKRYYPSQDYSHLKHPPFFLDDYVGESFDDPRFNEQEKTILLQAVGFAASNGVEKLFASPLALPLQQILASHQLDIQALYALYGTYYSSWGKEGFYYEIKAYKNEQCFASKIVSPSTSFHLEAKANKTVLKNEDSFDTASVYLRFIDQNGTVEPYCNDAFEVEAVGPIALLSPRIASLHGGEAALYVRSVQNSGNEPAKIRIHFREQTLEIPFQVR